MPRQGAAARRNRAPADTIAQDAGGATRDME